MRALETIIIDAEDGPEIGIVIMLHGRGVTGEDLMPLAQWLKLPRLKYIFPNAPLPVPDYPDGLQWFNLPPMDAEDIPKSRVKLLGLLHELEKSGTASRSITLMGFSQGAVMTLDVGIRFPRKLRSLIALSGYLHDPPTAVQEKSPATVRLPVFVAHGEHDPILPLSGSRRAQAFLRQEGLSVEDHEYDMGHEISPDELSDIRKFLLRLYPDAE
jgi:phospholipase/carboxylesterase